MIKKNSNSESTKELDASVPSYTAELGRRISTTIEQLGGVRAASTFTGASEDSLANWRNGRSRPSFFGMQGLAKAARVRLDWLATGEGPMRVDRYEIDSNAVDEQTQHQTELILTVDQELMGRCSDAFSKLYKELEIALPPLDMGRLAAEAYNDVIVAATDSNEQRIAIKSLIARHRRELLSTVTVNSPGDRPAS